MATRRNQARPKQQSRKKKPRRQRTAVVLRWSLVGVAFFVGFLYYKPVAKYFDTRAALNARTAEVAQLRAERARLARRLELAATSAALAREARLMGLVRPGEKLFIVKGMDEWRRANARTPDATVRGDG